MVRTARNHHRDLSKKPPTRVVFCYDGLVLKEVKKFYKKDGRHTLPWRKIRDPYKILVSEMMLQQTQVDRVVPKYKSFITQFPTTETLAAAPLGSVLRAWNGLGYNRRAKYLHETAKRVVKEHGGVLPREAAALEGLPGIGPYTARAVAAFAFNSPEIFIETNIRTVFLYHYFSQHNKKKERWIDISIHSNAVTDRELLLFVEKTLEESKMPPRELYWALMDYGAHLKKSGVRLNHRSAHYTKQSKFKGSARELRGALLRAILSGPKTLSELKKNLPRSGGEIERELKRLRAEGLLRRVGRRIVVV